MKRVTQISGAVLLVLGLASTAKAGTIDLTTAGASSTLANGVILSETDIQPTGTGVIDPFLRLQNTPNEAGINTTLDTPNVPILDDKPGLWTHDQPLSGPNGLTQINIGGNSYYKFLLDINQTAAGPLLNLNAIKFYVRGSAFNSLNSFANFFNLTTDSHGALIPGGALPTPTFDVLGGDNVLLNYSLNHGSGSGDMFMYVPVTALGTSGYLYLYNQNGAPPGLNASNDGFEEWAGALGNNVPVPDASTTLMLLGTVFAGIEGLRRKLSA
jgi:hypothetical protein